MFHVLYKKSIDILLTTWIENTVASFENLSYVCSNQNIFFIQMDTSV